jgi:hypothetical protein
MAHIQQVAGHPRRGLPVAKADAGMAPFRIDGPGQYVRHPEVGQHRENAGPVFEADQYDAVDAALDEGLDDLDLGPRVELVAGEQQVVAARLQDVLQALGGVGEDRVVQRRNDRADGARAARAQGAGCAVRDVTGCAHGFLDPVQRIRTDLVRCSERPRHGGRRDAGAHRHIAQLDLRFFHSVPAGSERPLSTGFGNDFTSLIRSIHWRHGAGGAVLPMEIGFPLPIVGRCVLTACDEMIRVRENDFIDRGGDGGHQLPEKGDQDAGIRGR